MGDTADDERPSLAMTFVLGSISTFAAVAIEMYLPALPQIASDLRSPPGGTELTISIFLVALAGGQLIYGPLSDRLGRRPPLLAGMALYCVASAACAMAGSIEQLIVFRFVQGLGGCAGPVIVRALIRDRYPAERVLPILTTLSVVSGLAPLLAPLAGGAVLTVGSWRAILWSQAAFGAVITLSAAINVKEARRADHETAFGVLAGYWVVLSNRRVMAYVLTAAFGGSVIFVYGALFPAIAHARFGLNAQQLSWTLAGTATGMMAGAQFNRLLFRRFSRDQVLHFSNFVSVIVAIVLCVDAWTGAFGFVGLFVPIFLIIALRGTAMPNAMASSLLAEDRHIGTVSAVIGASSFAGGALMSGAAAKFVDGTPRPMAVTILIALLLAAVAMRLPGRIAAPTKAEAAEA